MLKDKTIEKDEVKAMEKCSYCDFKTNNSAWLKKHLQNVNEDKKSKMI